MVKPKYTYDMPTNKRFNNLTGLKFGSLTVVSFNCGVLRNNGDYRWKWNCVCDCGGKALVTSNNLISGNSKTCGCSPRGLNWVTHGIGDHPLYQRCMAQIDRCHNIENKHYKNYGGRGIFVSDKWRNDVRSMILDIESEIGLPPFKGADIDRINNDLGYQSGNIRWSDRESNNRNSRIAHGHAVNIDSRTKTPTYNSWKNACRRYDVPEEWITDKDPDSENGFKSFLADMGEKPTGTKFHRIDKSLPCSKHNCCWK